MIEPIEAVNPGQLVPQSGGMVTVTIRNPTGLTCKTASNPDAFRPAIVGDVYSCQPNGSMQARPPGTTGPYELAKVVGAAVVFAPLGASGVAVMLPYATSVPNV